MPQGAASERKKRRIRETSRLAGDADFVNTQLETDVRVVGTELYFLPVQTRVPLKFGSETLTSVTCARVAVTVQDRHGRTAVGWGETPLNVEWVWPSKTSYQCRHQITLDFCVRLAERWAEFPKSGHPLEIGHAFQQTALAEEIDKARADAAEDEKLPLLAGLLCCSPFDIAVYDAYGKLHNKHAFETLNQEFCASDLAHFLESDAPEVNFQGQFPSDYLKRPRSESMPAWHLVGGLDPLTADEVNGAPLDDGHPTVLGDWIDRDGLTCLKIKLRGIDYEWDYERLVRIGRIAEAHGVTHLTADFNCTVNDPAYVVVMMEQLAQSEPAIYDKILYIEQPFPYDLERHQIDVNAVSARKPLLMDESAHNWELVRLGRSLGWNGVALKTCKTLTGALLSLCWAKAHGMCLMVQDLTNPMLAQIPHLTLAAYTDTLRGVETNGMQFYPDASEIEARVHPGIYRRREGRVDLSTLGETGLGYRVEEIGRDLPPPSASRGVKSSGLSEAVPLAPTNNGAVPPPHMELPDGLSQ